MWQSATVTLLPIPQCHCNRSSLYPWSALFLPYAIRYISRGHGTSLRSSSIIGRMDQEGRGRGSGLWFGLGTEMVYRVVQLNFTPEIDVFYMMSSLKHYMKYFNFRRWNQLDLPVETQKGGGEILVGDTFSPVKWSLTCTRGFYGCACVCVDLACPRSEGLLFLV